MLIADALINYTDYILSNIDSLQKVEYNKKGRKYRFVNNSFQRIRQEDKHLIICPEQLESKYSLYSAFTILYNIGDLIDKFPKFCCTILGLAVELESNQWYEEENSSIIHVKNSKYDPLELKDLCDEFLSINPIDENHIQWGINLMIASKLNFLHTDHHIGTKLEGQYMKYFIELYFGEEALMSHDVLIALKSCVHWGNIKGILYKLDVPNIKISQDQIQNFENFPNPLQELKLNVYDRYPSGTSKYSLVRKSIDTLADWKFSKLVPLELDIDWLYNLCHEIETNPIKFHLRSKTKDLCENPVNLADLNIQYGKNIQDLLNYISLIIHIFNDTGCEFLSQNSKVPKLTNEVTQSQRYKQLTEIAKQIAKYEEKYWSSDDIITRLGSLQNSLFVKVMDMREKYIDDYE